MTVPIAAPVETHGARSLDCGYGAVVGEQVEVAVHGAAADAVINLLNGEVDVLCGGMIAAGANDIQDELSLASVAALGLLWSRCRGIHGASPFRY